MARILYLVHRLPYPPNKGDKVRSYHLLRVRLDDGAAVVPEITGHRLMVSVRFMRPDGDARLRPSNTDTSFELTLCA